MGIQFAIAASVCKYMLHTFQLRILSIGVLLPIFPCGFIEIEMLCICMYAHVSCVYVHV